MQYIGAAFAPVNRVELDVSLPVVWWNDFIAPVVPAPAAENKMGIGDVWLNARFKILDDSSIGLAIVPFVTIPTGNENNYVSDKYPTGGFVTALDFGIGERLSFGTNIGIEGRQTVKWRDLDTGTKILLSTGASLKVTKGLMVKGDIYATTPVQHPFNKEVNTPSELLLALAYNAGDSGLGFNVGTGLSVVRGSGVPLFRTFGGVSYTAPVRKEKVKEKTVYTPSMVPESQVQTIYFRSGGVLIDDKFAAVLGKVAESAFYNSEIKLIVISGHTDSTGSNAYNVELSKRRAEAIANYLILHGIDKERIKMEWHGSSKPVADSFTKEGRSLNRRVEVSVVKDL